MMGKSEKKIGKGISQNILGSIKGVFAFFLVTLSLFNIFFDSKSEDIADNDKKYDKVVADRKEKTLIYRNQLKNKELCVEDFILKTDQLKLTCNKKIETLNKEKRKIKQDFSFRGRSSFHFWIFVFGLITALFYFSCKSLFDEFSKGSTFKHQFVSISGLLISGFWFIHLIFYTQKDFSKNTYFFWIFTFAILFSVFTYFIVRYYTYKDQIIFKLLNFIDRVNNKHLVDISAKAIYAEENGKPFQDIKSTSEIMREYDEDLNSTVNNI